MRASSRARLVTTLLAVGLLAAACGGDDTTADEPEDDARTDATSEVATSDDDRPATTTTSGATDQADATAEPPQESEPQPEPVRLGDRFPWCSDLQSCWTGRHKPKPSTTLLGPPMTPHLMPMTPPLATSWTRPRLGPPWMRLGCPP